ncbi:MAG: hypothetical protein H7A24_17530 [Leptospiraceae bacterium]|nr:hypothetical protein [Leptospiraceae bacterium]MCP5513695.1 hypothetical protein [Leptospiraceae bacterium]
MKFLYYLIVPFLVFTLFCKKSNSISQTEAEENKQRIADGYRSQIKDHYVLLDAKPSKEEALEYFLKGIASGNKGAFGCNEEEYKNIFLPNQVDENNLSSYMEPDKAWEIASFRREVAIESLSRSLLGKTFQVKQINWKKLNRKLNNLIGHQIGSIELEIEGEIQSTEAVKLIIEHENQFKVCVFAK